MQWLLAILKRAVLLTVALNTSTGPVFLMGLVIVREPLVTPLGTPTPKFKGFGLVVIVSGSFAGGGGVGIAVGVAVAVEVAVAVAVAFGVAVGVAEGVGEAASG